MTNPATPPNGATPGSGAPVVTPGSPAAATSTSGTTQKPVGATVTISAEEYANLQRAKGRTLGFDRKFHKPAPVVPKIDPSVDPTGALAQEQSARIAAEQKALQLEVTGQVRDLLADERFKAIPASTKKLILDAPHMLTSAETLEEAMFDIEDRLIEIAGAESTPTPVVVTPPRETPPVVVPGAPAPVDAGTMIDTTNLRGPARSQAILHNAMTKAKAGHK